MRKEDVFSAIRLLPSGNVILDQDVEILGHKIPKRFLSDGATIPMFFWPLIGYHPLSPQVLLASILHDYLIRINFDGQWRDQLFKQQLMIDGVPKWKAVVMGGSVKLWRIIKC